MVSRPFTTSETRAFVADMQRRRYCAWRKQLELFQVAAGVRRDLVHVPDVSWVQRYAANEDAFSAVLDELERFDC
jgi:hypothetical protein